MPAAASLAGSAMRAYYALRGRPVRAKFRAGRRVPARRMRAVFRRRPVRRVARRRRRILNKRRARMPLVSPGFQMSLTNVAYLRFKNVTEQQVIWNLANNSAVAQPAVVNPATEWMAHPGTNNLQESVWDKFWSKMLVKFNWKIKNIRVWISVTTTIDSTGTGASVTTTNEVTNPKEWVLWYYRQLTSGTAEHPPASEEGRFTRTVVRGANSSIWGSIPLRPNTARYIIENYETSFKASTGTYVSLQDYLFKSRNYTPSNVTEDATSTPSQNIWIMPDDPFPSDFYKPNATTLVKFRNVQVNMVFDCYQYATWKLLRNVAS